MIKLYIEAEDQRAYEFSQYIPIKDLMHLLWLHFTPGERD